MGEALRYWRFVGVDPAGNRQVGEIADARTFFEQQFPDLVGETEIADAPVQRQLFSIMQSGTSEQINASAIDLPAHQLAEYCLRCFISHQSAWICRELAAQFGQKGGFTWSDLYGQVLDDRLPPLRRSIPSEYRSVATRILQTLNLELGQLSTWTKRLVMTELNPFLLDCGIYIASDWSLLNSMTVKRLQRLLLEHYALVPTEIQQRCHLLESYHAVYRRDRLQGQRVGSRGKCHPPTLEQLDQMSDYLQKRGQNYFAQQIMHELQALAQQIRQSRRPEVSSLDTLENHTELENPQTAQEQDDSQNEFLTTYRQEFLSSLEQAIAQVVDNRLAYLRRKQPPTDQMFLTALHLFHCQGKSMVAIAPEVGLQKQYQVTRLLELKQLRADVRQQLLLRLRDRVRALAIQFTDSTRLELLDQQLDAALEEEVDRILKLAEAEAAIAHRPLASLFARRLCCYLDNWSY